MDVFSGLQKIKILSACSDFVQQELPGLSLGRTGRAGVAVRLTMSCVAIAWLSLIPGCDRARSSRPVHVQTPVPYAAPMSAPARVSPAMSVAGQFEHGKQVYVNHCAGCHGNAGQGSDMAPALVGAGALPLHPRPGSSRPGTFRTAMDVALFVTQAMPPDEQTRAQFQEQDYWAVLGFALKANGVELSEPVGPNNAASIVLHP